MSLIDVLRSATPSATRTRVIIALVAILFYCCNAEKRVLADADKTQNVVNKYLQTHPARIDTTIKYLPGDTVTHLLIGYDTTRISDTINRRDTIKIKETVYKTKTRVDTLVRTITDNRLLQACQDGLAGNDYRRKQAELAEKDARLDARKWKMWFFGLIVAIVIIAGLTFILKRLLNKIPTI